MKKPMLTTEKLRRQAEDKIATLRERDLLRYLPQYEEKRLLHELQVHQIELEMQNEQMRDIQTQLEDSRSRYKELYDFAPVGYVTLDKFGLIHEANLTAGTLLNVSRAALIGRQIQSFMDRESADALHLFLRKPLAPGVKEILDCRLRPAEGTVLDISLNVAGEFDPSDRLVGYRVVLVDVSRLKMMERQALDAGQSRYELMIAHSRDIVLFMRRNDGRILEANAAATKAYGYSREELLALTIHDLRAADTKSLTADQLAQADARGILFETVHRRKDGSTFPVEVSSQGTTIDGTRTLISIVRDITERRSAEAEILSLARYPEENPNPVLRASGEGALLYANQPARAMMESMGWREGLPLPESLLISIRDAMIEGRNREIELTCPPRKDLVPHPAAQCQRESCHPLCPRHHTAKAGREGAAQKRGTRQGKTGHHPFSRRRHRETRTCRHHRCPGASGAHGSLLRTCSFSHRHHRYSKARSWLEWAGRTSARDSTGFIPTPADTV